MPGKTKSFAWKKYHSLLHGSTMSCVNRVITLNIDLPKLLYNYIGKRVGWQRYGWWGEGIKIVTSSSPIVGRQYIIPKVEN